MSPELLLGIGVTAIGLLLLIRRIERLLKYYSFKKEVGSTYWGAYAGAPAEPVPNARVKLPKITFKQVITMGSEKYEKGKLVKSARG